MEADADIDTSSAPSLLAHDAAATGRPAASAGRGWGGDVSPRACPDCSLAKANLTLLAIAGPAAEREEAHEHGSYFPCGLLGVHVLLVIMLVQTASQNIGRARHPNRDPPPDSAHFLRAPATRLRPPT